MDSRVSELISKIKKEKNKLAGELTEDQIGLAFGYCRISTKKQNDESDSLQTQEYEITNYCDINHLKLKETISEVVSGKNNISSEGYLKIKEQAKQGDTVVFTDPSRMSRNTKQFLQEMDYFVTSGINVVFTQYKDLDFKSAQGKLTLSIMSSINEFNRIFYNKKTSKALNEMSKQGKNVGRPPFGYKASDKKGVWDVDPIKMQQVELIKELRLQEKPISEIVKILNDSGSKASEKSKGWNRETLQRVLHQYNI